MTPSTTAVGDASGMGMAAATPTTPRTDARRKPRKGLLSCLCGWSDEVGYKGHYEFAAVTGMQKQVRPASAGMFASGRDGKWCHHP